MKKEKREWRKSFLSEIFFPTLNDCAVQLALLIATSVIGTRATITVPVIIRSIITIVTVTTIV